MFKIEPDFSIPLEIVYEDDDVIVINKQPGISVHPSINEKSGTLANALEAHYPPMAEIGEDPARPGIVHRLDKDTSGLLVAAKNQEAFEFLKNQWQKGMVTKKYLALVVGRINKERGEIKSELARSKKDFRKRMVVMPKFESKVEGKMAITEYKVLQRFKDYTYLEVYPKTGRMHQIRVHFASMGNPVAGDKIYGKQKKVPVGLARQFLHAYYLSFSLPAQAGLPGGKKLALEADISGDLAEILAKLEK
ncbi:hypothetical protein A3C78_00220 [Candidatus Azambacteria bacterium RIFCSPHIGHO2_02_FULL_45_18]|nr:MAG: hypothetical protein A3C78_00220 [Candidatus Azambacteria bacterium RIFCSPHIGHO2_02_FULL_45_18]